MNQDHVFIEYQDNEIAAVRTDRRGKVITALSVSGNNAFSELNDWISRQSQSFVYVSYVVEVTRKALSKHIPQRAWIDIYDLAWPLVFYDLVPGRDLDGLCYSFNLDAPGSDLSQRVATMSQLYWAMMIRYRVALIGEEAVRGITHKILDDVAGLFFSSNRKE